ncbi:MAG: hypothetical protein ACYDAM_08865 [Leptospirales bacterium]
MLQNLKERNGISLFVLSSGRRYNGLSPEAQGISGVLYLTNDLESSPELSKFRD